MPASVDMEKCTGCKTCVDSCPSSAIAVPEEKAVISKDDCIDCGACVDSCEQRAIEMVS